ncbi:S-adenosyl-L-methionine-dependent methyltransferase [Obelidium mucronatum]|nr:S-adenosyl-L-methionine-dependent methyltransferase [Obelidium mucronatum]
MSTNRLQFPPKFTQWLTDNGVDPETYAAQKSIPRFIRVNPSHVSETLSEAEIVAQLCNELNTALTPVSWLPGLMFYSLDSSVKLSGSKGYETGLFAVHALSVEKQDHVLDLCCAPGGKMCLIADIQGNEEDTVGTVTGVDVSNPRISTCKSVLRKYKMRRFRLFDADGTVFNVHAPSRVGKWTRSLGVDGEPCLESVSDDDVAKGDEVPLVPSKRKVPEEIGNEERNNTLNDAVGGKTRKKVKKLIPKVKPFLATKLVASDPQIESPSLLYDKVLVDAECTHDGSIAHLKKCDDVGWAKFEEYFFDPAKMDALEVLQRGLLTNGFRLLKPGGILVYSTCSFSRRQNEGIVDWFLKNNSNAVLEQVPNSSNFPLAPPLNGVNPFMLRFSPSGSGTSGLFIARIRKS